jgi:hypothetical protein
VIELRTQKELRTAWRLPFCCICGKPFANDESRTRQHVPPRAIFAVADRSPPVILPAHAACNEQQSPLDEVIGQLVALLHGKRPTPKNVKLNADVFAVKGGKGIAVGVKDLPLQMIVFRWARYFHAALYHEYLSDRGGNIFLPFQAGDFVDGKLVYEKIHISRSHLTLIFKQQCKAGRTDAVISNNGKCQYRCTWLRFDPPNEHRTGCLFALRLYNWEELGDRERFPPMGCVAWYEAPIPSAAARATNVEIPVSNFVPFDPFGP